MYDVVLTRLAPDAHSAADSFARTERDGLTDSDLRILLGSFCAIAAVENAVAAPEIQVKTGRQTFMIRTGQKKLMLYDAVHRELPAFVVGVDEAMAELDGSAPAGRDASVHQHAADARTQAAARLPPVRPGAVASKPRLVAMGAAACALLGLLIFWRMEQRPAGLPAGFQAIQPAESAGLQAALVGVYLTGNQPGQHGIVFISTGDVKLFELMALAPPRIVYASGRLGRVGTKLVLATDQPGGAIEITNRNALIYGGAVYRRIP
jgi:hypothetical protein